MKQQLILIYTDVDGYEYYRDKQGMMVDKNFNQVSILEEYNVTQILYSIEKVRRERQKRLG